MYKPLINYTTALFNLPDSDFYKKGQSRDMADCKAIVSYILHRKEGIKLVKTGLIVGRSHNGVSSQLEKVARLDGFDKDFSDKLNSALEFYYSQYQPKFKCDCGELIYADKIKCEKCR